MLLLLAKVAWKLFSVTLRERDTIVFLLFPSEASSFHKFLRSEVLPNKIVLKSYDNVQEDY